MLKSIETIRVVMLFEYFKIIVETILTFIYTITKKIVNLPHCTAEHLKQISGKISGKVETVAAAVATFKY